MPNCSICGRPVPKVPSWLDPAKVTFRCNSCPGPTVGIAAALPDYEEGDEKEEDVLADVDIEVESLDSLEEPDDGDTADEEED